MMKIISRIEKLDAIKKSIAKNEKMKLIYGTSFIIENGVECDAATFYSRRIFKLKTEYNNLKYWFMKKII